MAPIPIMPGNKVSPTGPPSASLATVNPDGIPEGIPASGTSSWMLPCAEALVGSEPTSTMHELRACMPFEKLRYNRLSRLLQDRFTLFCITVEFTSFETALLWHSKANGGCFAKSGALIPGINKLIVSPARIGIDACQLKATLLITPGTPGEKLKVASKNDPTAGLSNTACSQSAPDTLTWNKKASSEVLAETPSFTISKPALDGISIG